VTITDKQRNDLYRACEETMGEGPAETLLSLLPPVGWADVATKTDLGNLRADFDHLRTEIKSDVAHLRSEIKSDLDHLRTELESVRATMATKENLQELRADVERSMKDQTRTMIFGLAGLNATFLAALLAGARLIGA